MTGPTATARATRTGATNKASGIPKPVTQVKRGVLAETNKTTTRTTGKKSSVSAKNKGDGKAAEKKPATRHKAGAIPGKVAARGYSELKKSEAALAIKNEELVAEVTTLNEKTEEVKSQLQETEGTLEETQRELRLQKDVNANNQVEWQQQYRELQGQTEKNVAELTAILAAAKEQKEIFARRLEKEGVDPVSMDAIQPASNNAVAQAAATREAYQAEIHRMKSELELRKKMLRERIAQAQDLGKLLLLEHGGVDPTEVDSVVDQVGVSASARTPARKKRESVDDDNAEGFGDEDDCEIVIQPRKVPEQPVINLEDPEDAVIEE